MYRRTRRLCLPLLVVVAGCGILFPPFGDSLDLFDEVWNTFDAKYSYFVYKNIDWDAIGDEHRPNFAQPLSANEFAARLATMLAELRDVHVNVEQPDGTPVEVFVKPWDQNFPTTPRNRYTAAGYQMLGSGVVYHAWIGSGSTRNIGYVRVDTLATSAFASISDAAIDSIFQTYAGADGMILDIRANNGGNETIAAKFASHFTNQSRIYAYHRVRNGPLHSDFDPIQSRTLDPAAANRFLGPVACLIGQRCLSSAESFALMMRACPNVTLIGQTTRGGSGNPETFTLSNGVKYTVSRWVAYDAAQVEIEDHGVAPNAGHAITAANSLDGEHDYVVEAALDLLEP